MYCINKNTTLNYGNVIEIIQDDDGELNTPFQAYLKAKLMRRLWMEKDSVKVKIVINNQILTVTQAEIWAYEESKRLPKCKACAAILKGDVYTHPLCGTNLFCTQVCADKDHAQEIKRINDEDESDCF